MSSASLSAVAAGAAQIPVKRGLNHAADKQPGAAALIASIAAVQLDVCEVSETAHPAKSSGQKPGVVVTDRATGRIGDDGGERQCYDAEKGKSRNITRGCTHSLTSSRRNRIGR